MQHWEFVEAILPPYRSYEERKRLAHDIRKISAIVLSVALGMYCDCQFQIFPTSQFYSLIEI